MKKTYEKPELNVAVFDVEDVITASAPASPIQNALDTVGDLMENIVDMFNSMGN